MPQNRVILWGRKSERCGDAVVTGLLPLPAVDPVNRALVPDGCLAATRKGKKQPLCLVNAYINHGDHGRFREAASSKAENKESELLSAATDGLTALSVGSGVSASLDTEAEEGALNHDGDSKLPDPNVPAVRKRRRRRKRKSRPESIASLGICKPVEEDWEKETVEVKATDWERNRFRFRHKVVTNGGGPSVCRPEVATVFQPRKLHLRRISWFHHSRRAVEGQFEDAD